MTSYATICLKRQVLLFQLKLFKYCYFNYELSINVLSMLFELFLFFDLMLWTYARIYLVIKILLFKYDMHKLIIKNIIKN